jgi:hypothetical protein
VYQLGLGDDFVARDISQYPLLAMPDKVKANSAASDLFQTHPLFGSGTPVPREKFARQNTDITLARGENPKKRSTVASREVDWEPS